MSSTISNETGIVSIDKIFVINLDHNVDRLHNFGLLMSTLGYKFERYKAVNGQKYKPTHLSSGEYGCFLSHKNLWKRIAKDPAIDKAIIFEDDVELSAKLENAKHAKLLIEHYINQYSYDMFYLGKCLDRCDLHVAQGSGVVRTFKPLCAHAYVLTKEGAKKLIEYYREDMKKCVEGKESCKEKKEVGPRYPADVYLQLCIEDKDMLVYAAQPSIFVQNTVCYNSNMRSKLGSLILNTKECGVPQCVVHIYIFIALVSIIFIIVCILWAVQVNKRKR